MVGMGLWELGDGRSGSGTVFNKKEGTGESGAKMEELIKRIEG